MTVSDSKTLCGKEVRGPCPPKAEQAWNAAPRPHSVEARAPVVYDKVDYRLMDTFPASDAVAQY